LVRLQDTRTACFLSSVSSQREKNLEVPTPLERESSHHFAKEHQWKNAVESKSADRSSRTRSVAGSSASRRSRQIGKTVKIPTLPVWFPKRS
jgi:hypothetical protein